MPLLTGEEISGSVRRTYHVQVPADPVRATLPVIIVFHGGGQDAATIAARWGVDPPSPVPADLADYLLVFPESDPLLSEEWVHFTAGDSAFPTHDLEFVRRLLTELSTRNYPTGSVTVPTITADPCLAYAAGFSNGAGMVWQLLNSELAGSFRGFAAVGKVLDPEKSRHYRNQLAASGAVPAPAPVVYLQGTADRGFRPTFTLEETPLEETLPFFTVQETLLRNQIPADVAATATLVPGSTGVTEVVLQLFAGAAAFLQGTVVNGGHNWPTPATVGNPPVAQHFDATSTIVEFWRRHAGLPEAATASVAAGSVPGPARQGGWS
jgi:poly(3-hydroxybutyrate) depolymerase